jgi:hypothetical protein
MSTIKSLFEHSKAVIVATHDASTKRSKIYLYDLESKAVTRYEATGEWLNWGYKAVMAPNADLVTRLTDDSMVYDKNMGLLSKQIATRVINYHAYLIIDSEVKLYVDCNAAYLPDGREPNGTAKYIQYNHKAPNDTTTHGVALFTLERYKQIVETEATICKIMNMKL